MFLHITCEEAPLPLTYSRCLGIIGFIRGRLQFACEKKLPRFLLVHLNLKQRFFFFFED